MKMHDMKKVNQIAGDDGKFRQFIASLIVNLTALSYGIICGWPSPMIPLLRSKNNPVENEPMSEEGASWIGAILCLGGAFTIPFAGSLIERIGRKGFGYAACVPNVLYWILVVFASSYKYLYVARFVGGIGGAMSMFLVPIYVSEIASEEVRGALGSLLVFAINIGILFAFAAGPFLPYTVFSVFSLMFPLLFLGAFIFIPETPVYLVKKNRLSEATKSLMFLKNNNKILVDQELTRLQTQVNDAAGSTKKPGFCDLIRDQATFRGMIIALGLLGGQQFSGIFAMISYAETIFTMSGSSLSPATAAIIIGTIQVFGSYLSTILMERAGRRILILVSCAGMCICHITIGIFCYFQNAKYDVDSISWVPVFALSVYMISYCLGIGPAPFVVTSEIFRLDIASLATTVCYFFLWSIAFVIIKLFNPTIDVIGIDGCFIMLGFFSACTFIFTYYLLPETKGRKLEDIVNELAGIRRPSYCDDENIHEQINTKDLIATAQV